MKILVITSSSHQPGTSTALADKFVEGATAAHNQVIRFDADAKQITPMAVKSDNAPITGNQASTDILQAMLDAELIVFATPLYYYGMSAQLKAVIDRMYEINCQLQGDKQSILLATAYGSLDAFDALVAHYKAIVDYMQWTDTGMVLAVNSYTLDQLKDTNFLDEAYELGLSQVNSSTKISK
jgi:multimeric flavodoxin WrbA